MRGVAGGRVRRRRPGAAAAAYSHALTVLRQDQMAESVARIALKRGAQSRTAVLAHARHETLALAETAAGGSNSDALPIEASGDPRQFALQLAATRPAVERAIADLELRYSLDTTSLSRALGLTTQRTNARAREVVEAWAESLDPAMLAWLGPGSCGDLKQVLDERQLWPREGGGSLGGIPTPPYGTSLVVSETATGTDTPHPVSNSEPDAASVVQPFVVTVDALLEVAPQVLAHTQTCEICSQRLRLMTSVRTLFGQTPVEAVPSIVAESARTARRRLPAALPPSIEPKRIDPARLRTPLVALVSIAAATAIVLGAVLFFTSSDDGESQATRVERLLQAAPPSGLVAGSTVLKPGDTTTSIKNGSTQSVLWHATPSASWMTVTPNSGRIEPSQSVPVTVHSTTPGNDSMQDATVSITGSDGSQQTLHFDSQS